MSIDDIVKVNITPPRAGSVGTQPYLEPNFENYRTVAFTPETMKLIELGRRIDPALPPVPSPSIDVTVWISLVPECYQAEVWRGIEAIFPGFNRMHLTPKTLSLFCSELRRWIGENVEPVR